MSTKTSNKKVAQRIFEKTKVDAVEGKFLINEKSKMAFDQLVNEFLEKHSKVEKESYVSDVSTGKRLVLFFKHTPIGKITSYDIKSWRQWRKEHITRNGTPVTKATLNVELSFLKKMFNLAVEWGWLKENPALLIKRLKGEKKRMRFLNRKEVDRLIECSAPFLKPIIITAVSSGMRRGEIFNLKWKDIDFEHGFIRVEKSKNKETRDIPVDGFLSEILTRQTESKKNGNYVFCKKDGARFTCISKYFRAACKKAGIEDFRFHDLRHTAASLYASGGCDITSLKNLLGHKSLEMTQRYAHLMPDMHDKTRLIMQNFWGFSGDTVSDTPLLAGKKKSPEKQNNK
jgi:integrase